jgi:Flp pilus assembly protein TadD
MSGWLSRALTRISAAPAPVQPLPEGQLRKAVEAAKRTMAQGGFASARSALRDLAASNPDDAEVLAHYGVAAYMAGDPADARVALVRAVQIDPNHLVGQKFLAAACDSLGDLQRMEVAANNALRLAPRDREALNVHGVACMYRFQVDAAANSFGAAVEVAPNDITALVNIERLSMQSLRHHRVLDRSPKIAAARSQAINRLRASHRRGQLDDKGLRDLLTLLGGAQDTFAAAAEIAQKLALRDDVDGGLAEQIANVFMVTGNLQGLLKFRKLTAEQNAGLPARANLAFAQLSEGYDQWHRSWQAIADTEHPSTRAIFAGEVPKWTGQRPGKKKILVYQEQGFGDAMLALRLIPLLARRGVRFDLWVAPTLAGLASSAPGCQGLLRSEARPDARALGCELASTLFGLIPALGVEHEELKTHPTVLSVAPVRAREVRARMRALPGRRIGLAYGGNPDRRDDWFRAVSPSALKPLAALEGISWVNLAIDRRPDKPEVIRMLRMEDPMTQAGDFEDTAAIIDELDAVVAIDSSVAHLACSLGKPVWVLVPPMLDWRWQIGSDTRPWWPTATLLRSPAPGAWDSVIEELARQLRG